MSGPEPLTEPSAGRPDPATEPRSEAPSAAGPFVPALIHQTWKVAELPERFREASASWRRHHSAWEYRLWTDDDLAAFVHADYPHLWPLYQRYPHPIQRVDAARYMLLHRFGGLYADLDVACLHAFDELRGHAVTLPATTPFGFSNDLMMARPGHPLFAFLLGRLEPAFERWQRGWVPPHFQVLHTTGSLFLTSGVRAWTRRPTTAQTPTRPEAPEPSREAPALEGASTPSPTDPDVLHVLEPERYRSQDRARAWVYHHPGDTWAGWDTKALRFLHRTWQRARSVWKGRLPWVLGWALLTAFVAWALPADRWDELGAALAVARPGWLAVGLALNLVALPVQAAMWMSFLPAGVRVSWARMLEVAGVVASVANSVPVVLGGHASGAHVLATRGGTGHAVAFSVVALDQFAEGIAKIALLVVVALWAPLPGSLRIATWALVGLVGSLGVVLVTAERAASRRARVPEAEAAGGVRAFALAWARGLHALRSPLALARGIGACLVRKALEALSVWAVMLALAPGLPLWSVPLALAAPSIATMVAVSPANLGVYEAAAYGAWTLAGAAPERALMLALVQHMVFLGPMLGGGWMLSTATALTSRAESGSQG